jgi:hypothetical protein
MRSSSTRASRSFHRRRGSPSAANAIPSVAYSPSGYGWFSRARSQGRMSSFSRTTMLFAPRNSGHSRARLFVRSVLMDRKPIPQEILTAVIMKSARRCPLCFYLSRDLTEKLGQVAHLDKNRSNPEEDNLAFMCLEHHSWFDSTTSQHKNYTLGEVKGARAMLYSAIARNEHGTQAQSVARKSEERARIAVRILPDASKLVSEFRPDTSRLEVLFILPVVENFGKSVAKIVSADSILVGIPAGEELPAEPDYNAPGFQKVAVDIELPQGASVQPWKLGISNFDFASVFERRSMLWLYGVVHYEDIYGDHHESRFCFSYLFPGGFNPSAAGFYSSGPKAYRLST